MLTIIKQLAREFGCTAYASPDGNVFYYLGKQPDGLNKEELGSAVWTGKVHGADIESTKGIIGPATTIPAFWGAVSVALADYTLSKYIKVYGAYGIPEADDEYNDIARAIIRGMSLYYGAPKLGFINICDAGLHKAVVNEGASPFFPVPETCYNFCADFILPPETEENKRQYQELAGLIRYWNTAAQEKRAELLRTDLSWYAQKRESGSTTRLTTDILNLIKALGGYSLHWS